MSFKKYIQITSVLTAFFALVFIKNALGGGSEGVAPIAPNPTIVASLPTTLTPSSSPLVRGRETPTATPLPTDTPTVPAPSNLPTATPNPTPTTTPRTSQYKDGAFTGSVADAFYGNVQVKVTVSQGKISQVDFLQYPNDQRTSQFINSQAMPLLQQEAITAQSERVSGVSGASATSGAFVQSLGNALTQARA